MSAVVGAFILTACGTGNYVIPTADPSSTEMSTDTARTCTDRPTEESQDSDEKFLTTEISKMQLPSGICLFMVFTLDDTDEPGNLFVSVDLDVPPSMSADNLRPIATDIARLVKKTEIAQRISTLSITNSGTASPKIRTRLSDKSYREHPWNGTPSEEAEQSIWKITETG
ncbi:hypothetical protein [Nocardia aurea]|uniref:hypothetical protein n=1 Tax=Nocardia aurea TaxID=2144174 RepID=UPI0033B9521C